MQDNIIYYNINESDYTIDYKNLKFYFSSKYYRDKFRNRYKSFIQEENYKLQSRFNINLDFREMLLFYLYQRIEKRGFKVEILNNNEWANINEFSFKSNLEYVIS